MMPGNLFRLELAAAFADRRRTALRVGLTLLLALPFVLVDMPARAQAAGLMMVILFTSFFGAAVRHARLTADQRLARLALLPTWRPLLWLDLVLSSVLARLLPTAIVLTCYLAVHGRGVTVGVLTGLFGLLCASVGLLTLLGIVTAKLSRNNQEVHLFGALAVVILACICGITPLPEKLKGFAAMLAWNPVGRLHLSLAGLANGSAPMGSAESFCATLVLAGFVGAVALRWLSGGLHGSHMVDAPHRVVDNGAPLET